MLRPVTPPIPVEQKKRNLAMMLLSHYIKYDRLTELCQLIDADETVKVIDVYIDVYDIMKSIYNEDVESDKQYIIASAVLNLAAHYRGYFKTRHGLWTRIFLVYSDESNMFSHQQFVPEFGVNKKRTFDVETSKLISSQLKLVEMLCKYLNDIFFIKRTGSFITFTYGNIANNIRQDPKYISILVSSSKYMYQIPAMAIGHRVYQLRPLKDSGVDNSVIITPTNAILMYYNKLTPNSLAVQRMKDFNPRLLSLIWTFNGCDDKNISMLTNITKTTAMIADAIREYKMINDYQSDIKYLYHAFKGVETVATADMLDRRFKAIDLMYQYMLYSHTIESKDMLWNCNLYDPKTVEDINLQYFSDNPLDMQNL